MSEPQAVELVAILLGSFTFTVLSTWLAVGTAGLMVAAVKLHAPGMLSQWPALTYGRLYPAAMNCLLYGFAAQAGGAIALWMLSRLGGARLALMSQGKRDEALQVHRSMTYLELTTSASFFDRFTSASFLPHTDQSQFPSLGNIPYKGE